jgi:hypothetical protein
MHYINQSKHFNDHASDKEVKNQELNSSLFQTPTVIPTGASGMGHRSGYF